ncbi:MAG: filamentous hemagglutinin N-terminal domain-containing protein [Phycisphaeraceae bacterium]
MMSEKTSDRPRVLSFPYRRLLAVLPLAAVSGMGATAFGQTTGSNDPGMTDTGGASRVITTTIDNAIINHRTLGVNVNESLHFAQPTNTSRVLNRVQAIQPTHINGTLTSNGFVYIANPAGVYVGPNGLVNVGGIYAAAGNITDSNFLNNVNHFSNLTGEVINHGTIHTSGTAALIGQRVANHGSILSTNGLLIMAAGDEVILQPRNGHIMVKFPAGTSTDDGQTSLVNNGVLDAGDEGAVILGSSDMYGLALHQAGSIKAKTVKIAAEEGRAQVSGTISATDKAQVTAKELVVADADISASNEINIGGEYKGGGELATAQTTFVSDTSSLTVGEGGTVTVWGDLATGFYGSILAPGGFAEVSGGYLEVDLSNIVAATLLLDPFDVTISAGASANGAFTLGTWDPSATGSNVDVADIVGLLNAGTSVTIETTTGGGGENGDVTLSADLIPNLAGGEATFIINAAGGITISNVITASGDQLNVDFNAGGAVAVNANITTNGGDFTSDGTTFTSTATINAGAGLVTINHSGAVDLGSITGGATNVIAGTGGISDGAGGVLTLGDLTLTDSDGSGITLDTATSTFGTLTFTSAGVVAITENAAINLAGASTAGSLDLNSTATIVDNAGATLVVTGLADFDGTIITLNNATSHTFGTLTFNSAGAVTIDENNATDLAGTSTALSLDLNSGGAVTGTGATLTVTNLADFADTGGAGITLDGTNAFGTLTFNSTGAVAVTESNATDLAGTSTAGSLDLNSGGAVTGTGATLTVTNLADFADTGGAGITLDGTNAFGTLTFNSTGAVVVNESDATDLAGTSTAGSLDLNSGGAVTGTGATLTVTNLADFADTGGAGITLDGTNAFGTLTFNSTGAVVVNESDATAIAGSNTANSLDVNSSGALTDAGGSDITVVGLADFAGTTITLNDTNAFGTLTFNSAGAVVISETDATNLAGTSTALNLDLNSGGALTGTGATLTVTNLADFADTGGAGITLDGTNAFGTLTFNSTGAVVVNETDATSLESANTALSLDLNSGGAVSVIGATLSVTNLADFADTGGAGITISGASDFGTLTFNSTGAVVITETDATDLAGTSTAGSLDLNSGGALTGTGATLTVTNLADFADAGGAGITLDGTNAFGQVTFNSTGAVVINETDATDIAGSNTANALTIVSGGALTDAPGADMTVVGLADFTGTSILLDGTNNFGSVTYNSAGDVSITQAGAIVISGTNTAGSLSLTSTAGTITDDGTADLTVTGLASFTGTALTLDDTYAFGTLTFNSAGAVAITEADAATIAGTNTALSLDLNSGGAISDAPGATTTVTNLADFADTGGAGITLDGINSFGSLTFNSTGAVSISQNDSIDLAGSNTANTLNLISVNGSLTDAGGADLTVTGLADFTIDNTITLDGTNAFGQLTFNAAGAVAITESDATDLAGTNTALSLDLNSGGAITDAGGASLTVTQLADFADTGGAGITLDGTVDVSELTVNSTGDVVLIEANGFGFEGANTADNLTITVTNGAMLDGAGSTLAVTSLATFTDISGGGITLDNAASHAFGQLTFNGGAVTIVENDATDIAGSNSATSLNLTSGGALTDAGGADITVVGLATFDGTSITLDGTNAFGSLTFNSAGAVAITEADATDLAGTNTALSLDLNSGGAITDVAGSTLVVTNNADFAGTSISLSNNVLTTFGSLTFNSAGSVVVIETDDTNFAGANTADSLTVASLGAVADDGGSTLAVTNNATFSGTSITLDNAASHTFGGLTFNSGGAVAIVENDATNITGSNTANSLNLDSGGAITDASGVSITVTNLADFADAGGAGITLGDNAGDTLSFGTTTFNSTGAVAIAQDNDMTIDGTNTALSANLVSDAGISNSAGSSITVTNLAMLTSLGGNTQINVGSAAGDTVNFGQVTFNANSTVTIREDSATEVAGTNTSGTLNLFSTGDITDASGVSLTTTGPAIFSGTNITLGDNGGDTVNFDSLTFVSGGAVVITEDSSTELRAASSANSLILTSAGAITDETGVGTTLNVTGSATFDTNTLGGTSITLGETDELHNFGSLTFVAPDTGAGVVTIVEQDSMNINDGSDGGFLFLTSDTGSITTASGGISVTTGSIVLSALTDITVAGDLSTDVFNLGITLFSDSASTGAGGVIIDAPATLSTEGQIISINGEDVAINGLIDTDNGAGSFGPVQFTETEGDGINIGPAAATALMDISDTELGQITAGIVTFSTTGTITIDGVTAGNTANINGAFSPLTSGDIVFGGTASTITNDLNARADQGIDVNVDLTTTMGNITLNGDANAANDAGDDAITIAGGVTIDAGGSLTLLAPTGGIIGSGVLTLQADNGININSNLTAGGATTLDADEDDDGTGLLSVPGGVTVNAPTFDIDIFAGDIDLDGQIGVNAGASPATVNITATGGQDILITDAADEPAPGSDGNLTLTGGAGSELARIFSNDLMIATDAGTNGDITINTVGGTLPGSTDIATAFWISQSTTLNDGTLTFDADGTGDFAMTQLAPGSPIVDRFTVVNRAGNGGSLVINANDVTVTDLTAATDVTIAAVGNINLLRRPSGTTRFADGTVANDSGADIVVGRSIILTGAALNETGTGEEYKLSSVLEAATITFNATLAPIVIGQPSEVILTFAPGFVIDGASSGSSANVATAIAAASPRIENAVLIEDLPVSQAAMDQLAEISIFARDHSFEEVVSWLVGQRLYDDLPRTAAPLGQAAREVAIGRLNPSLVESVLSDYQSLISRPATDDLGQPMFDPTTGEAVMMDLKPFVRSTLQSSFNAYMADSGGSFDPMAYRSYLQANNPQAYEYLLGVQQVVEGIELLALPPVESQTAIDSLLRGLTPENMTIDQLKAAASASPQVALAQ